jgi:hypothetical protein
LAAIGSISLPHCHRHRHHRRPPPSVQPPAPDQDDDDGCNNPFFPNHGRSGDHRQDGNYGPRGDRGNSGDHRQDDN